MNVICLYWRGKFRGRDFVPEDVIRLRWSVEKHIDRPLKFYCLTNDLEACIPAIKIPMEHPEFPGWWGKIELHRSDLPPGRTLYMDLDSHAIRPLGPILDFPGNLVMFNTRNGKVGRVREKQGKKVVDRYQAATMLFDPGSTSWLYDEFLKKPEKWMATYRSEQDIMGELLPDQPTFPDEWMMKMNKCVQNHKKEPPPEEVIIVTGQPSGRFRKLPKMLPWLEPMARG